MKLQESWIRKEGDIMIECWGCENSIDEGLTKEDN